MPKISLILPLYNAEKYLVECLNSVKNQTFADFECLCIDDGCTDGTIEIINAYAQQDPRFILIQQENQGCSAARNTGLKNASAPYVMLLDQDDVFHPQAMQTLYYLITKYGTDIASFKYEDIDNNFKIDNAPTYNIEELPVEETATPLQDFLTDKTKRSVVVWVRIYNKAAIDGVFFPVGVQPAEDSTFTLKAFRAAKDMVSVNVPMLFYRIGNDTSVMTKGITEKYVRAHYGAAKEIFYYFQKDSLGANIRAEINKYVANMVYKSCISQVLRLSKTKHEKQKLLLLAHGLMQELIQNGIFDVDSLKPRRAFATKLFMQKLYFLARVFI